MNAPSPLPNRTNPEVPPLAFISHNAADERRLAVMCRTLKEQEQINDKVAQMRDMRWLAEAAHSWREKSADVFRVIEPEREAGEMDAGVDESVPSWEGDTAPAGSAPAWQKKIAGWMEEQELLKTMVSPPATPSWMPDEAISVSKEAAAIEKEREAHKRELRDLDVKITGLSQAVKKHQRYRDLLALCKASRQLWERILDRRIISGVAPHHRAFFNTLLRNFIHSIDEAESVREKLCEEGREEQERAAKFYGSMAERRLLAQLMLWGEPDLLEALHLAFNDGRKGTESPAATPALTEPALPAEPLAEEDWIPGLHDATCAWVLANKFMSWAMELSHEAGPWRDAVREHVKISKGASRLLELADHHVKTLTKSAWLNTWRENFQTFVAGAQSHIETLKMKEAAFKQEKAGDAEIERWLKKEFGTTIAELGATAAARYRQLLALLPGDVWQAWLVKEGDVDTVHLPPQSVEDRHAALTRAMNVLDELSLHVLEEWLKILSVPDTSGVEAADEAALLIAARAMELNFPVGAKWLGGFLTRENAGISAGYFQLAAAAAISVFYSRTPNLKEERAWLFHTLESVHRTPSSAYESRDNHAAVSATLFATALVESDTSQESLERIDQHLDVAMRLFSGRGPRRTWLQLAVSELNLLLTPESAAVHYVKMDSLLPLLRKYSLHFPGPEWLMNVMGRRYVREAKSRTWYSWLCSLFFRPQPS